MNLYEKLQHARSEEDVKDAYIKALFMAKTDEFMLCTSGDVSE
jgi:hypothetical protein